MAAASMSVLFGINACALGASTPAASPSPSTGSSTPSPVVTSPSPSDATTYPNLSRFSDPLDRVNYKSAYSLCKFLGVAGTADEFGGESDDPNSVARAYAEATFPRLEEYREPPFWDCLDALKAGTQ